MLYTRAYTVCMTTPLHGSFSIFLSGRWLSIFYGVDKLLFLLSSPTLVFLMPHSGIFRPLIGLAVPSSLVRSPVSKRKIAALNAVAESAFLFRVPYPYKNGSIEFDVTDISRSHDGIPRLDLALYISLGFEYENCIIGLIFRMPPIFNSAVLFSIYIFIF